MASFLLLQVPSKVMDTTGTPVFFSISRAMDSVMSEGQQNAGLV